MSFLIVRYFTNLIFMGYTPKIRRDLGLKLATKIQDVLYSGYNLLADRFFYKETVKKVLEKKPLIAVGKGVYTSSIGLEKNTAIHMVYYENEIEWLICRYDLIIDGKPLVFRMPKTINNPGCLPKALAEKIF